MSLPISLGLFVFAGLCEIGGGYLVCIWFREGRPLAYGIAGAIIVILYGIIPTCNQHILVESMLHTVECLSCYPCHGAGVSRWSVQIAMT